MKKSETRNCIVRSVYKTTLEVKGCNPESNDVRDFVVELKRDAAVRRINGAILDEINAALPDGYRHVTSKIVESIPTKYAMPRSEFFERAEIVED